MALGVHHRLLVLHLMQNRNVRANGGNDAVYAHPTQC